MGVLHVERIHNIITQIEKLDTMKMMDGQPTQAIELRLLINWYGELSGVLKVKDVNAAMEYIDFFSMFPPINTGDSLIIPRETEDKMFTFKLMLFSLMYKYGLLTKRGVQYGHLEY